MTFFFINLGKYIKKSCEVAVAQTQKRVNLQEKEMKDEIEQLRHKVDEETRVNAEIESYLRTHQSVSSLMSWHFFLLSQILRYLKCALPVVVLIYIKNCRMLFVNFKCVKSFRADIITEAGTIEVFENILN